MKFMLFTAFALLYPLTMGFTECLAQNLSVEFKLKDAPFSIPKSGMSVCDNAKTGGLVVADIRYALFGKDHIIFKLFYAKGTEAIKPATLGTPGELSLFLDGAKTGSVFFENHKLLRFKGEKHPLQLRLDSTLFQKNMLTVTPKSENVYLLQNKNVYGVSCHVLTCHVGSLRYDQAENMFVLSPSKDDVYEISLEETDETWATSAPAKSLDQCVKESRESFARFVAQMPALPPQYEKAREFAAYVLWSSELAGGYFKRPGMLMSKNWMHFIWSWDHCFNAMACAYHMPLESWNNLMVVFDGQKENGQLPNRYSYAKGSTDYRYLKPPIHGWSLRKMRKHVQLTQGQLEEIYVGLSKWTDFWLSDRDSNKNGLPEYIHGYDSGWDNGTEYDYDGKDLHAMREGADLAAYLVLQMDMLHDLALELGKPDQAEAWKQRSDKLLDLMLKNLWNGNKFVTKVVQDGYVAEKSQSLMQFLPLILGEKLPRDIRTTMIENLKNGGFITQWGLASESVNSPLYGKDSYWRGPIWAPSTMIVVEGLNNCGEKELARDIARRFCDLCAQHGFAENFDAKTGQGHRDLGYTWTASVFLILGHEYLMD